jgi:uncharacterized membrane protein YphA (DoxX/SURF4 family)
MLVLIGIESHFAQSLSQGEGSKISFIGVMIVMLPMALCVVVGYKTKVVAVVLAITLTIFSLYSFPFFLHLADGEPFLFWMGSYVFGSNFSGVGSLIYIAVLGAGTYSVDHMKRQ